MFSDHAAKTKRKGQEESIRHHHSGPYGAPAPPRHQSHTVNHVLREKKLSQFLQLLTDALLRKKVGENTSSYKRTPTISPAKVHIAFTCKTCSDIHVEPGERRELQVYKMIFRNTPMTIFKDFCAYSSASFPCVRTTCPWNISSALQPMR
ncbi:unnamed protein product [Staurois parvus]|uniref:Uncharacterized protein n=1 Tax=Staurois parvus TaxID=386267 RepID=A0ABN9ABD3_9NEOB|nr:unnamed protein product [Staurois parvus]